VVGNLTLPQRKVPDRSKVGAVEKGLRLLDRVSLHAHASPRAALRRSAISASPSRALAMDPIAMMF
jgi:hypothetical protein